MNPARMQRHCTQITLLGSTVPWRRCLLTAGALLTFLLLVGGLSGCSCAPVRPPDALEPNDTPVEATPLELGAEVEAGLNIDDTDVFVFEAEAGDHLILTVETVEPGSAFWRRYWLFLHDRNGFEITRSPLQFEAPWSPLEFEVPESGRYYVELGEALFSSDVDYFCVHRRGSQYRLKLARVPG